MIQGSGCSESAYLDLLDPTTINVNRSFHSSVFDLLSRLRTKGTRHTATLCLKDNVLNFAPYQTQFFLADNSFYRTALSEVNLQPGSHGPKSIAPIFFDVLDSSYIKALIAHNDDYSDQTIASTTCNNLSFSYDKASDTLHDTAASYVFKEAVNSQLYNYSYSFSINDCKLITSTPSNLLPLVSYKDMSIVPLYGPDLSIVDNNPYKLNSHLTYEMFVSSSSVSSYTSSHVANNLHQESNKSSNTKIQGTANDLTKHKNCHGPYNICTPVLAISNSSVQGHDVWLKQAQSSFSCTNFHKTYQMPLIKHKTILMNDHSVERQNMLLPQVNTQSKALTLTCANDPTDTTELRFTSQDTYEIHVFGSKNKSKPNAHSVITRHRYTSDYKNIRCQMFIHLIATMRLYHQYMFGFNKDMSCLSYKTANDCKSY